MMTYLVRTRADCTLVGVFCASSEGALAKIISPMIEPEECEYLALKANEGLFVEAQFIRVSCETADMRDRVYLTNSPMDFIESDSQEPAQEGLIPNLKEICAQGSMLKEALEEEIPPVLEPTEALAERLHTVERTGWHSFTKLPEVSHALSPRSRTPILLLSGGSTRQH